MRGRKKWAIEVEIEYLRHEGFICGHKSKQYKKEVQFMERKNQGSQIACLFVTATCGATMLLLKSAFSWMDNPVSWTDLESALVYVQQSAWGAPSVPVISRFKWKNKNGIKIGLYKKTSLVLLRRDFWRIPAQTASHRTWLSRRSRPCCPAVRAPTWSVWRVCWRRTNRGPIRSRNRCHMSKVIRTSALVISYLDKPVLWYCTRFIAINQQMTWESVS